MLSQSNNFCLVKPHQDEGNREVVLLHNQPHIYASFSDENVRNDVEMETSLDHKLTPKRNNDGSFEGEQKNLIVDTIDLTEGQESMGNADLEQGVPYNDDNNVDSYTNIVTTQSV